jgi:hypothetical protein
MNYDEHPPAHFHVRYQEHRAKFRTDDLRMFEGWLPPRIRGFITEWAALHHEELIAAWDLARLEKPIPNIKPLE